MYTLKDFQRLTNFMQVPEWWNDNIFCLDTDGEVTLRANITQGFLSAYTFTIVLEGWVRLQYSGQELTFRKDNLFIYLPGLSVTVLEASDDYRGICLLADEGYTLELPVARNAIRTAYFPLVELTEPKLKLQPQDVSHLADLMRLAIHYQSVSHPQRDECLSLTQIADRMNFTSLSYFSRYCTKHLGQSPSDYRRSLQPRG